MPGKGVPTFLSRALSSGRGSSSNHLGQSNPNLSSAPVRPKSKTTPAPPRESAVDHGVARPKSNVRVPPLPVQNSGHHPTERGPALPSSSIPVNPARNIPGYNNQDFLKPPTFPKYRNGEGSITKMAREASSQRISEERTRENETLLKDTIDPKSKAFDVARWLQGDMDEQYGNIEDLGSTGGEKPGSIGGQNRETTGEQDRGTTGGWRHGDATRRRRPRNGTSEDNGNE